MGIPILIIRFPYTTQIMKEKFTIEFGLKKGSTKALWTLISTPHGLAEWMADNVDEDNTGIYTFSWKKSSERAKLLEIQPEERIRFRWMNAPEDTYFEIEIIKSELTGEISLLLTDFAASDEKEDLINLWASEIDMLIRRIGL